jgi:hypothetical protein
MRNIFDQYAQPENRVTHALMTALDEDRALLGLFLQQLVKVKAPVNPRKLSVLEQQYPGEEDGGGAAKRKWSAIRARRCSAEATWEFGE